MRTWRYLGVHRLTWVVIALLVVAVAVFAMAAGFSRLRRPAPPEPAATGGLNGPTLTASIAGDTWHIDLRPTSGGIWARPLPYACPASEQVLCRFVKGGAV
jgi:hypothetical protein